MSNKYTSYVQLLFLCFISLSVNVLAQEMLTKKNAKYVGKRSEKLSGWFETCKGDLIPIGNGKVELTDERCVIDQKLSPIITKASVEGINVKTSTVTIKDTAGITHEIKIADPNLLKTIKVGDEVNITMEKGKAVSIMMEENNMSSGEEKPEGKMHKAVEQNPTKVYIPKTEQIEPKE